MHKTRKSVFTGDERTLNAARIKINEEFKKNKDIQDENTINDLIKTAREAESTLRVNVIQAKQKDSGNFGKIFP